MLILALDPATTTGVAWLHMGQIRTAVWDCSSKSRFQGRKLRNLYEYLQGFGQGIGYPDHLIYERTVQPSSGGLLQKFQGIIEFWCEENNVPCSGVVPSQWKKSVLGSGRATKEQGKYYAEKLLGCELSQDEADAVCILQHYKGVI